MFVVHKRSERILFLTANHIVVGEDASDEEEQTERAKRVKLEQPAEHKSLFEGNCDDHFRIGLKITRCMLFAAACLAAFKNG